MFEGGKDMTTTMHWIVEVESAFNTCFFLEEAKVRFAENLMHYIAKDW